MSTELSPINRFTEVKAGELQEKTRAQTRKMLERHDNFLGSELIARISEKEGSLARNEYVQKRVQGLANDTSSERPGLVLYVEPDVKDEIIESRKNYGEAITEIQITKINSNLFSINFPDLKYSAIGAGVHFYEVIGEKDIAHMALVYSKVVRIESIDDELWQNKDFDWHGKPKNTPKSEIVNPIVE